MASAFKSDSPASEKHGKKQTARHKGFWNDQVAYELQNVDASQQKSLQEDHALSSLVSHAGRSVTTANLSGFSSFQQEELSQDPQSMPELGNMQHRSVPSDPPLIPERLTVLPGQLNRGYQLTPSRGPSIEQRRMKLPVQDLNLEQSRPYEHLGSCSTKAPGSFDRQQQDFTAERESIYSIPSDFDAKGDTSAGFHDTETVPIIQDRRVPKDKQVVYCPGGQHYHKAVTIEKNVADQKLPLDTILGEDDRVVSKAKYLTGSPAPAQFSQAPFFEREDHDAESSRTSGNLHGEVQRQTVSTAHFLPRIVIDQPTEAAERQSLPSEVGIVSSPSESRAQQLDRAPISQKKPTSDYDALKDILLVYQGQEIAPHLDPKCEAVQVALDETDEFDIGRRRLDKGNSHKRSVAIHLSAGSEHQFNEIQPLNIRSKHCDELESDGDIDTQVEGGYGRSQDENFSELSWMSSDGNNVNSQAASSGLALHWQQEEDGDLRCDKSGKLSDSTPKDEVSEFAESFSTSHLEPGDSCSEDLVDHVIWNSNRNFLERGHINTPFMTTWPEGSQHLEGQVSLNQYWSQENDGENHIPSQTDVDSMSGMSGLEKSQTAAAEVDVIPRRGRNLLSSRHRSPTPPLLYGRRPIVHKQGQRGLLNRSSLTEIESELGMKDKSHLATAVISPNDLDWESVTEQKSSEGGITAGANKIINTVPNDEDREADNSQFGSMSARLAKQYKSADKESEEVIDSKHKKNLSYFLTCSDKMNTSQPLRKPSLEDQVHPGDPFDDPGSESSASLSAHLTKKAYQHPSPLLFRHVAPLKGSSLLQASTPSQDLSARKSNSETLDSMTDFQRSTISPTPVNGSAKGKKPLRGDDVSCHSSLWLSTVEERPSEFSSFRSMKQNISGPVLVSSNQETCKDPFHVPNTRNEQDLGALNSSPVPFPSRLTFATKFSSGQRDSVASSQTRDGRSRNEAISHKQGEHNLKVSTMFDTSYRRDCKNKNNTNVSASTQSSSSNWLHTDKSQQTDSELGSMQPNSSAKSGDEIIDWSKAYKMYLPPLGPRQNDYQSSSSVASPSNPRARTTSGVELAVNLGHDQLTKTENSHGGKIWVTNAEKGISSRGMPNSTYHLSHQGLEGSPNSLFPPPQVHYLQNGQVFTEDLPRFLPHPVYGFDCPWDRRHPFARSESPHLHAREMRDTPESRLRERVYSVTFAVFCCLTVVLAPLYGHGLLDSVMVRVSGGEFRRFRHQDKLFVLALTYIVLALLVIVLPITVITLSN